MIMRLLLLVALTTLAACTTSPPRDPSNICAIFEEKGGWYDDAADARDEWGSPIAVMMAIMHQESRFKAKAKPPRKKIFGFIPGPDRDDFGDSIDFIGWYNYQSHKRSGISRSDPYRLYLAYHEGHGGYNRGSYRSKQWLKDVARKVERVSNTYSAQLRDCEEDLKRKGWFFGWF